MSLTTLLTVSEYRFEKSQEIIFFCPESSRLLLQVLPLRIYLLSTFQVNNFASACNWLIIHCWKSFEVFRLWCSATIYVHCYSYGFVLIWNTFTLTHFIYFYITVILLYYFNYSIIFITICIWYFLVSDIIIGIVVIVALVTGSIVGTVVCVVMLRRKRRRQNQGTIVCDKL